MTSSDSLAQLPYVWVTPATMKKIANLYRDLSSKQMLLASQTALKNCSKHTKEKYTFTEE